MKVNAIVARPGANPGLLLLFVVLGAQIVVIGPFPSFSTPSGWRGRQSSCHRLISGLFARPRATARGCAFLRHDK